MIWAVVLLLLGLIFVGFGLRGLLISTPVLMADAKGLHLHLGHPLSRLVTIPWEEVDDIGAEDLNDDGSVIPVMWVRVTNPDRLPANPWGARWIEPDTLAVMAADWEQTPRAVAEAAAEIAVTVPPGRSTSADAGSCACRRKPRRRGDHAGDGRGRPRRPPASAGRGEGSRRRSRPDLPVRSPVVAQADPPRRRRRTDGRTHPDLCARPLSHQRRGGSVANPHPFPPHPPGDL